MKLAIRFFLYFAMSSALILVIEAYVELNNTIAIFKEDLQNDHVILAHSLVESAKIVWQLEGEEKAVEFLEAQNRAEESVEMNWVWLDSPEQAEISTDLSAQDLQQLKNAQAVHVVKSVGRSPKEIQTFVPIFQNGLLVAAVQVSEPFEPSRMLFKHQVRRISIITAVIVLIFGGLAWYFGLIFIANPIRILIQKSREIANRNFATSFRGKLHDEFAALGEAFNQMAARLQEAEEKTRAETAARIISLEQLRHADRLATVGRLAAGVAHELGTPLNVIWQRAKMVYTQRLGLEEAYDNSRIIAEQSERITKIIRHLLDFARPETLKRVLTNLGPIVKSVADFLKPMAQKKGATIEVIIPQDITTCIDPEQMQQVISNLTMNGIQALNQPGKIVLTLSRENEVARPQTLDKKNWACIKIQDTGVGIDPEKISHIFDPFFTTKDVGEGTGLGLSVARGIVEEHGGWIQVESRRAEGSTFTVYLPLELT